MSIDMYARYVNEREKKFIYQTEHGFAKYSYDLTASPPNISLEDIYILPEFRRSKKAIQMADAVVEIGRGLGCKQFFGCLSPQCDGAHESMLLMLHYGMKIFSSAAGIVFFYKEI